MVAADDVPSGGGFTYYIDGRRLIADSSPAGVFSPRDAAAALPDVAARYAARMEIKAEGNLAMAGQTPVLAAR